MKIAEQLFRERVTLRVLVLALGLILTGLIVMGLAIGDPWSGRWRIAQAVMEECGALLFVTATITLVWELGAKRAFLDEILVKTQAGRDVVLAGLSKITNQFLDDIEWRRHIQESSKIDICFAYARTWRGAHENHLKEALKKNAARIRIVLPDPENATIVSSLTQRFRFDDKKEVKKRIQECIDFVGTLSKEAENGGGSVELWLLQQSPVFTFYRFDRTGIIALYKHQKGRGNVPTLLFRQGGILYDFMRQEFDAMIDERDNLARKVDLDKGDDDGE